MEDFKKNPKVVAREAEGEHFLIPVSEDPKDINKVSRLNQLGWFIWQNIDEAKDLDQLVFLICEAFDVRDATAKRDAREFLQSLTKSGALLKGQKTE